MALIALLALAILAGPPDARANDGWQPLARGADTTTVGFRLDSGKESSTPATLSCLCRGGVLSMTLTADSTIVGPDTTRSVRILVDQSPAALETWAVSEDRRALLAPEPHALASRLRTARALLLRIPGDGARRASLEFNVRGFEDVLQAMALACPLTLTESKVRPAPPGAEVPAYGEFVHVDELPEAITKVAPVYPANRAEGTVMVQALVGKDGRVLDTKIVKSVPGLDEAAAASVRQWTFKPALANSKPVAVWVVIPIKFTVH
jgi:TonB family protein